MLTPHMTPIIINFMGQFMSSWDKLIEKLLTLDPNIRFKELKKILESCGYKMNSTQGSHCTFRKAGSHPITIPKHKPITRVYIEMVRDVVVGKDGKENDN